MKRFLKKLLIGLGIVGFAIFGVIATLWFFPGIVVNDALLRRFVTFETGEIDLSTTGLLKKRATIGLESLCFDAPAVLLCAGRIDLVADLTVNSLHPIRVNRLTVEKGTVEIKPAKEAPASEDDVLKTPESLIPFPALLKMIAVDSADLEIASLMIPGEPPTTLSGNVAIADRSWKINAKSDLGRVDLVLSGEDSLWFGPFQYLGEVEAKQGKLHARTEISGEIRDKSLTLVSSGEFRNLIEDLPVVTTDRCTVIYRIGSGKDTLAVDCPTRLMSALCRAPGSVCRDLLQNITATLKADIHIDGAKERQTLTGDVGFTVDQLSAKYREGQIAVQSKLSGKMSEFPKGLLFDTTAKVAVVDFRKIVALLRETPYAIPAPFSDLGGNLKLEANAKGNFLRDTGKVEMSLVSDLSSPRQVIRAKGEGELALNAKAEKAHLDFALHLDETRLVLPRLSVLSIPKIFPDSRIIRHRPESQSKPKKGMEFTYKIDIKTEKYPVLLTSNLAKGPIPIRLNLVLQNGMGPTGTVRIQPFPIEILGRDAEINKMDLSLHKDPRFNEVDGIIEIPRGDYRVRVVILGQVEEPQIHLESIPPLPQDQVLSALLFGKPQNSLSQTEAASVGNTQAALKDKSLSLASMFILASTPVESINYDPISGDFIAKVRIDDKTSVDVGSNFRQFGQVGIRRSLGGNWSINTTMREPFLETSRSLQALLEWSMGY